jgi:hypothetical protein
LQKLKNYGTDRIYYPYGHGHQKEI